MVTTSLRHRRHVSQLRVRASRLYLEQLESRTLLSNSFPLGPVNWTALGPAPLGPGSPGASGRVAALAPDPTNAHIIYLAAAGGGGWETARRRAPWHPL